MREPISVKDFMALLNMAVDEHKLDPAKTYVEFTWWDGIFKPLTCTDCNNSTSTYILVFGEEPCNKFSLKHKGFDIPTGFYINKTAVYTDQVLHRPLTVKNLLGGDMAEFDNVKFLFANSPINYYVDINPFRTRVYKNMGDETILALYAEDRDSGEWMPFSGMSGSRIELVDDSRARMASDACDGPAEPDPPADTKPKLYW